MVLFRVSTVFLNSNMFSSNVFSAQFKEQSNLLGTLYETNEENSLVYHDDAMMLMIIIALFYKNPWI